MSVRGWGRLNVTGARVQGRDDHCEVGPGSRPGKDASRREGREWGAGALRPGGPPLERGAVRPDGVHHDGQLAGHGDLGLLEPGALLQP